MIEAVLWDFGGVLTSSPFEAFNRFESERGIPLDFIRTINATNPETNAWARFESSQITPAEFDVAFADESAAAGHRIPGREVIALLSGDIRPRMVRVLEHCKQHFRVACITNNVKSATSPGTTVAPQVAEDDPRADAIRAVMAVFDLVVESSIEGVRKPDPAIYQITCDRLGVAPERAVFLDDLGVNLKPARAMGMQTIKVIDEDQAITELYRATGLSRPS